MLRCHDNWARSSSLWIKMIEWYSGIWTIEKYLIYNFDEPFYFLQQMYHPRLVACFRNHSPSTIGLFISASKSPIWDTNRNKHNFSPLTLQFILLNLPEIVLRISFHEVCSCFYINNCFDSIVPFRTAKIIATEFDSMKMCDFALRRTFSI